MAQTAIKRGAVVPCATAPVLPEELVVWEILVRLPAKTLIRCRAVCRSWHRLASAADFLLAHNRLQPSLPLVTFRIRETRVGSDAAFDAFDLRRRPTERQPVLRIHNHRNSFAVHASCDGLILLFVSNSSNSCSYVCNPATRQWISLPRLDGVRVAGMYSHSPSGEYRVLFWRWAQENVGAVYYVLTVGSSAEPRYIGQPIASPDVQMYVQVGRESGSYRDAPSVLLHDCMHWIPFVMFQQEGIVVFNTVKESFRLMRLPSGARRLAQPQPPPNLLVMDGTLGISLVSRTMLKLWVLQDYETEAWSLKFQIEFPVEVMGGIAENSQFCNGMIVSENGDALIHSVNSHQLFHLDSKGKLLQRIPWDRNNFLLRATGFQYKESLIRHAFLERPIEGGRPGQPSFFHGL